MEQVLVMATINIVSGAIGSILNFLILKEVQKLTLK